MMLQRAILRNLEQGHDGIMATGTLWAEVYLDVPEVTYTEFSKELRELEMKGQVLVIKGQDRNKAKITDAGKLRLLEA